MKAKEYPRYTFGKGWISKLYEDLKKYGTVEEQIVFLRHVMKEQSICYGSGRERIDERQLLEEEIELRKKILADVIIDDVYKQAEKDLTKELKKYFFNETIQSKKRGMIKLIADVFEKTYLKYARAFGNNRRTFIFEYFALIFKCLPIKKEDLTIKQLLSSLEK